MHQTRIFTIILLMLLLLSACAPAQDVQPIEPKAPAVSEPTLEVSEPQESDSTSADVAQNEAEKPSEPENIVIQTDLSTLPELDLIEPETRSAEEYFTQVAEEEELSLDRKNFHLGLGSTLNELPYSNMP